MRTFIAIELPEDIKDRLGRLQDKLRKCGADVKWVEPENIHLTLKFLGERDDKKIAKISEIVAETAKNHLPFLAHITSVGAFPKIDYPRVIWVGVEQGDAETKKIAQELEEKIATVGIPKEDRPFSSHITIGRTRSPKNREKLVASLKNYVENLAGENLEFTVGKITLFKSTLAPSGPVYEALKEITLTTT
ncbi:MAG: RNA 2',3'-cyclic phosphodiesterase [Candidatus Omnitrophica bacterium CG08_land_8_20_14_0_20_41_16]|uniref:RNA 2',3'-cyclic phosphodiesterase n=1 Tax=Candidatus Sherwoodlollariibacterium unditelluris TaxID=1974757 RepID=A0A2G9YHV0_9BACT|nr:MAG: RNA 2',3'-cyclic phosphodiesterase [Candidatus Omnitrophica bacterium CG23_combo_of_CG06-09_8_20_14_all_41_10]PIS34218.1 MAG: RNA 2',3'-cyclic phosphodiesterase [Candidatus Omnitrophica bacterium CG08_land_8_20_14_0_20_41_16]